MSDALAQLIARWKDDAGGAYRSWFLWEQRIKSFRQAVEAVSRVLV